MTCASIQLGAVVTLQRGYDLPAQDRQQGAVPVVSSSGITGYHSEAGASGPGVITGRYGTIGEVQYVEGDYWPHNTTLFVKDFKGNDPLFVRYLLVSLDLANQVSSGAVPGVNRNVLHAMLVPDVPKSQQRAIASCLSAYDDLIENNLRRMTLLEESARLLYKEWFVHLRFPGHEHTRILDGVPEGWDKKVLGSVAEINRQSIGSSFDGEIEYIDIASVSPGHINETIVYDFAEAPSRARRVVQHGDTIWSSVRPNRRSHALIWQPPSNLIVSTGFAVITPTRLPASFLYFTTTTDAFVGYLDNHAKGAAYPAVLNHDFERAEILVPPHRLTDSFNKFIEPSLAQIHNLRVQNQKHKAARDLLLPKLMSGEIAL